MHMGIIRKLRWEIAKQLAKRSTEVLQRDYKSAAEFGRQADRSRKLMMLSYKFIPRDKRLTIMTAHKEMYDEAINRCMPHLTNKEPE